MFNLEGRVQSGFYTMWVTPVSFPVWVNPDFDDCLLILEKSAIMNNSNKKFFYLISPVFLNKNKSFTKFRFKLLESIKTEKYQSISKPDPQVVFPGALSMTTWLKIMTGGGSDGF